MLKTNQAERKMLGYINGWKLSGIPSEIITHFGEITTSHKRYPVYLRAIENLAKLGLVKECGIVYHSLETTCSKCGEN